MSPERTATPRPLLWLVFLAVGIGWGTTQPLAKFAVTSGLHPFGLTFWQALISGLVLTALILARGGRLPLTARHLRFYAVCGFLGTAFPHTLSYTAAGQLPAGIISILMATVPMMTLLVATAAGVDRPGARRITGLSLGALAVVMIVAPGTSLPDPAKALWALLPLLSALCYAGENTWIDAARPKDVGPIGTLCGLNWAALAMILPFQAVPEFRVDPTPLAPEHIAMFALTAAHIVAYSGLIWLIGRGGAVFASQVGYVVMGAGVLTGMAFLGERHPATVWLALALMAGGIALVKPRSR